jgi:hypothetical protein
VLLLHLQAAFELEPQQIALLFLPGAIVLAVLPERAYELAIRLGRARSMMFSLVAGALFTASLALFDTPVVVAALWMLCAAAIATALPVEQATVAQASAGSLGRGMGLYETAALLGAVIASPVLAAVYGARDGASRVPLPPPASSWEPHWCHSSSACSDCPTSWHRRPMPDPARAMPERPTPTAATPGHPAAPKTPDLRQGGQDRSSALSPRSRSRRVPLELW